MSNQHFGGHWLSRARNALIALHPLRSMRRTKTGPSETTMGASREKASLNPRTP